MVELATLMLRGRVILHSHTNYFYYIFFTQLRNRSIGNMVSL